MHHLFLCGASSSIDQIKKAIDPLYVKAEQFMPTLIEISDKKTDADGKIRFRLKEDTALLSTFDPYLIVQEQHQSMQQAAYEDLHKKKPCLNNIVGDYQQHYKYQTQVNQIIMAAISNSSTAVKLVTAVLKQCFEVRIGIEEGHSDKQFKELLFNQSLMHAALKLQLIICEHVNQPQLVTYIRRNLTPELFGKLLSKVKSDEKLEAIIQHLQKLVHPPTATMGGAQNN